MTVDANGTEHMILTFYVQGKPEGWTQSPSDLTYLERTSDWARGAYGTLTSLTLKDSAEWTKEKAEAALQRLRDLLRYLSGVERSGVPPVLEKPQPQHVMGDNERREEGGTWTFAGIFSSLKGSKRQGEEVIRHRSQAFTEGDVHADLVRVRDLFLRR